MEIIKDADIIGVAWGTTINEVINYLPAKINKNVEVVQVTGGIHQLSVNLNCHDVARRFADRFGVEPHLIYAPAIVESKELHDLLLNEPAIKKTFSYFDKINCCCGHRGTLSKSHFYFYRDRASYESDLESSSSKRC
jgi:deoxyribonucleoside regulator